MEQQLIGQLAFNSSWNLNALYTDKETQLKFVQKGFWDRDVLLTKSGNPIGEIHIRLFGDQTLELVTGERFTLTTSIWEQEVYWKNEKGETVITYQQAPMSAMGKGSISANDTLTDELEKILISSGVFVRQLARKRRVLTVAIMLPIVAAASQ